MALVHLSELYVDAFAALQCVVPLFTHGSSISHDILWVSHARRGKRLLHMRISDHQPIALLLGVLFIDPVPGNVGVIDREFRQPSSHRTPTWTFSSSDGRCPAFHPSSISFYLARPCAASQLGRPVTPAHPATELDCLVSKSS